MDGERETETDGETEGEIEALGLTGMELLLPSELIG